jgi:hypothetical protein
MTGQDSRGNPPKSWMVRACSIVVTATPGIYQCADMQRIGLGLGIKSPISAHASVYPFVAMAFIGLPWPKKIEGILSDIFNPIMPY